MTTDLFGHVVAEAQATYGSSSASATTSRDKEQRWWSALRHGGCLIAPSRLAEYFPRLPEPLPRWTVERLRRDVGRLQHDDSKAAFNQLLETVFVGVLGLSRQEWVAGNDVPQELSVRSLVGDVIKPRRVWRGAHGSVLPVFVPDEVGGTSSRRSSSRLGMGRGRRAYARVLEWLRKTGHRIALLTNGHQWRLVHAGADYDAWCEWDIDSWFQEGEPGDQLAALRLLLGVESVGRPTPEETPKLIAAIQATRRGQAELSSALGERVRQAVELLLREAGPEIDKRREDQQVSNRDIYVAAVRLMMRTVVVLFAESRLLLPIDKFPVYERSYSLATLITTLDREGGGRPLERLRGRYAAWPRLLALFRLLYNGVTHDMLTITRYGGGLFQPGDASSSDPVLRALAILEQPSININDGVVAVILELLTKAPVKVRQGRSATKVMAPVDFSQLDTEYIGILYEGLLDYELRRVEDGLPIVFLAVGDQPALPLHRLEEMDDKALAELVKKIGKPSKEKASDDEGGGDEESDDEESEDVEADDGDQDEAEEEEVIEEAAEADDSSDADSFDTQVTEYRQRALDWARRAVIAGKIVPAIKGKKTPEKERAYEDAVTARARDLILKDDQKRLRILLPGEYYLVRFGGTRKGSGTFYTKPQLARPTVRRTLEPLCYEESQDKNFAPRTPAEILDLKVADIAAGSGSFLVSSLRYLTSALYEALLAHGWLVEEADGRLAWGPAEPKVPDWFKELLADVPGINDPVSSKGEDTTAPEDQVRSRLRRVIVERCIYGVDLDPLAVELARLSLWVETMDPYLPFSFLDHKIKVGNALVGCWFDRFQDYPALAWEREGGDKSHSTSVHYDQGAWTKAIKEKKKEVKAQLGGQMDLFVDDTTASATFQEALRLYQKLHEAGPRHPDEQEETYREYRQAVAQLRRAFDTWCAVWFWPADKLDLAPMPANFGHPGAATTEETARLANHIGFFHWELEFPDVFNAERSGYDAIVGNPPWDNAQPNPKEWFSNVDPLFRTYTRTEAQNRTKGYFSNNDDLERSWLIHNHDFKAFANWVSKVANPSGGGKRNHQGTRESCSGPANRLSYSDPNHPFVLQIGRVFTYKLFLEQGLSCLAEHGRLGMIVPSSLYTDVWAEPLRKRLLFSCRWEWVFSLHNADGIFSIHKSSRFCPVIVEKGWETEEIKAAFMKRDIEAWEEAERHQLKYPIEWVRSFSPNTLALLEIRALDEVAILKKMGERGLPLCSDSAESFSPQMKMEFASNTDSKRFPSVAKWTTRGFVIDEYGHALRATWQSVEPQHWDEVVGTADRSLHARICSIEEVGLPVLQGGMIANFNFKYQGYFTGSGSKAQWKALGLDEHQILPQFIMSVEAYHDRVKVRGPKVGFRWVSNPTNQRTFIIALLPDYPATSMLPTYALRFTTLLDKCSFIAVTSSFCFDYLVRMKFAGGSGATAMVQASLTELPGLGHADCGILGLASARLSASNHHFSESWVSLCPESAKGVAIKKLWAVTDHERLRLRCILDAVVAHLYGLDAEDFRWILRDCDHPVDQVTNKAFARTLDPKGFWRVDKHSNPELRHAVLAQVAFADLQQMIATHGEEDALRLFLGTGPDDGWMIPETLRLADYNLGHDARAQQPQKVAAALGPRFYDWQLTQSPEESWEECRQHADKIRRIRAIGRPDAEAETPATTKTAKPERKTTLKAHSEKFEQQEIFDIPEEVAVPAAGMPEDRLHLYLAILLEVARTRPGIREVDAGIVLSLLHEGEKVAGRFPEDLKKRFLEAWDRFPEHLLPRRGESELELFALTERLESLGYIALPQEGAHRALHPTDKKSREEWAKWTTGGLVEMILEDLDSLKQLVPVNKRGRY